MGRSPRSSVASLNAVSPLLSSNPKPRWSSQHLNPREQPAVPEYRAIVRRSHQQIFPLHLRETLEEVRNLTDCVSCNANVWHSTAINSKEEENHGQENINGCGSGSGGRGDVSNFPRIRTGFVERRE